MPLNIRSEEVNRLAEKLASVARVSKSEAVRIALANALGRRDRTPTLAERLRPIQDGLAAAPKTGLEADKALSRQPERRVMFVDAWAIRGAGIVGGDAAQTDPHPAAPR